MTLDNIQFSNYKLFINLIFVAIKRSCVHIQVQLLFKDFLKKNKLHISYNHVDFGINNYKVKC